MALEREFVAERTGTNVALVWLNTEVNLFVVLEMSCLRERRVASLAFVWFFTGKLIRFKIFEGIYYFIV